MSRQPAASSMTYPDTPAVTTSDLYPAPVAYDSLTAVKRRRAGFFGETAGSRRVPASA
jgi:hypothetical protein